MKLASTLADRVTGLALVPARAAALLAFDRASVRRTDADGHLFIETANLSAAGVSPYRAEEVPGWQALGLQPGQTVQLLRPAEELARAAPSFCGKPVLLVHKPISADDHPHSLVVGAIGGDARFEAGFLRASLSVWDAAAIASIEDGSQRDLSCGYRYVPVMEGGSYQGISFDGRMTQLSCNHLAIVPAGRVPDCVVGDSAFQPPRGNTMPQNGAQKFAARDDDDTEIDPGIRSQLLSYLQAVLPSDQLDDVTAILAGQTVASPEMASDAAAQRIARRVVAAHQVQQSQAFAVRFPDAGRLKR